MKTYHQYIEKYPIQPDSKKLILGTIHPHDHEKFKIPFFYGNNVALWKILQEAFHEEFENPITLAGILNFLQKRKIAVSDTVLECERLHATPFDKHIIPTRLHTDLIRQIRESNIEEILFTSGFGNNNAFRLFYVDILGLKLTQEIRANRGTILHDHRFTRPIKLTLLYSPAGTANVGLSKSNVFRQQQSKYANLEKPIKNFKLDYFKKIFSCTL